MVKFTGFRIDASQLRRKCAKALAEVRADAFKPQLLDFVRKSLSTAVRTTPVRDYGLIQRNQSVQYDHRIGYIPSIHTLEDPTLIVKSDGHWLYCSGKWYRADKWNLPSQILSQYAALLAERERRRATRRSDFIKARAQARFLYRKSWGQVANSIGLSIPVAQSVLSSVTRRKPPEEPDRGYAQIRGGKIVLNVIIFNPFLETESRYKPFSGREILANAIGRHRSNFERQVKHKMERILYSIFQKQG